MPGQSPPTTSGIVVLSGSNNFGTGSDFPVFSSISISYHSEESIFSEPIDVSSPLGVADAIDIPVLRIPAFHEEEPFVGTIDIVSSSQADLARDIPVLSLTSLHSDENIAQTSLYFVANGDNIKITPPDTTTSGVVILDIFPDAGVLEFPYVPPLYVNQRLFPVTFSGIGERVFPEENRRVYPVLPQYSTLTPGD